MAIGASTLRNCGRFLIGDWAEPVGQMCYQARKSKTTPTSMLSFGWKKACSDYWAGLDATKAIQQKFQPQLMEDINKAISGLPKGATAAARKKAIIKAGFKFKKTALKGASAADKKIIKEMVKTTVKSEVKTGFFSKIGKFLGKIPGMKFIGKNIIPIMMAVQTVQSAIEGYKDGGIGGAIKEAARGLLKMGGYSLALAGAAALGMTGIGVIVAGLAFSFVLDKGIDFVLGKSPAEKQQLAQETNEQTNGNPFAKQNNGRSLASFGSGSFDPQKFNATVDAIMGTATKAMENRHNYYA